VKTEIPSEVERQIEQSILKIEKIMNAEPEEFDDRRRLAGAGGFRQLFHGLSRLQRSAWVDVDRYGWEHPLRDAPSANTQAVEGCGSRDEKTWAGRESTWEQLCSGEETE